MKLVLDTNRYTDLMNGVPEVVKTLESADAIYLPFITIAELRAGFAMGTKGRANEQALSKFMSKAEVVALYPDEGTTVQYAAVYRQLRQQATPIPTNDMWIAALVLQHDLFLCARRPLRPAAADQANLNADKIDTRISAPLRLCVRSVFPSSLAQRRRATASC
jgi:predicted nucleic acid-binding protein